MSEADRLAADEQFDPTSIMSMIDGAAAPTAADTAATRPADGEAPSVGAPTAVSTAPEGEALGFDEEPTPWDTGQGTDSDNVDETGSDAAANESTLETSDTHVQATKRLDVYRVRQLAALGIAAVTGIALWWLTGHGIPGAAPSFADQALGSADQPTGMARNAVPQQHQVTVTNDQGAAVAYHQQHGTYRGLTLPGQDVRVATATDTVAVSRIIDGTCWKYGVRGETPTEAVASLSGAECTDAEMTATQVAMDDAEMQYQATMAGPAEQAFAAAGRTAAQYALGSFDNGAPSLDGLTGAIASGVVVTENGGTWVSVEFTSGTACYRTVIGADGTVGDTLAC